MKFTQIKFAWSSQHSCERNLSNEAQQARGAIQRMTAQLNYFVEGPQMLKLSRVIAMTTVMMMTFGSAVQAKELRAASAKPQGSAQAVESADFTLYWYV